MGSCPADAGASAISLSTNLELLGLLAAHLLLTGLPAAAAALLAARAGVRSVPLLLAIALAGTGGVAILSFWLFYLDPTVGQTGSFFFAFGSVLVLVWCLRAGVDRPLLRALATPFALWALASAFVVFLGFLHGGTDQPLLMASSRFSSSLPNDNEIPSFFADYFYMHGHSGTPPLFGDWLSSDRPPLQIGYILSQRPFGWDTHGLNYELLGVLVQQLWVLGMWALLCAARLRPRTRGLAMLATIVSDIAILHGFYVWPKLIAAAFLLGALALVVSEDWPRLRRQPLAGALFAALIGLAMLAHGSSAFFALPLVGLALWKWPSWSWIGTAVAVGALLMGSWSAYQHYADPPGNRLVKWQIGGSPAIDDRGVLETIVDSYREAGVDGTIHNKWVNLDAQIRLWEVESAARASVDLLEEGHLGKALEPVRGVRFYGLLPFLGLLLLGPLAMLFARLRGHPRGPDWRFAVFGLGFSVIACLVWDLLIFGGTEAAAIIHQGSLALPLLAACVCVVGACAVDLRFGTALVLANVALVLLLYVPSLSPPAGTSYSLLTGLIAAALAGIGFLTLRPGGGPLRDRGGYDPHDLGEATNTLPGRDGEDRS